MRGPQGMKAYLNRAEATARATMQKVGCIRATSATLTKSITFHRRRAKELISTKLRLAPRS